jgi:hypothetical protein
MSVFDPLKKISSAEGVTPEAVASNKERPADFVTPNSAEIALPEAEAGETQGNTTEQAPTDQHIAAVREKLQNETQTANAEAAHIAAQTEPYLQLIEQYGSEAKALAGIITNGNNIKLKPGDNKAGKISPRAIVDGLSRENDVEPKLAA